MKSCQVYVRYLDKIILCIASFWQILLTQNIKPETSLTVFQKVNEIKTVSQTKLQGQPKHNRAADKAISQTKKVF